MGFLKTKPLLGLLLLMPLLMANKQCNRDITWGDVSKDLVAPWAADHKDIDAETKCSDCHDGRTTKSRPKSHDENWTREHGSFLWKKYGFRNQGVCYLCHQESQCVKCHQQEPPENHTEFWRLKGHAGMVGLDRSQCSVCHKGSDFCERCHSRTEPQTHTAGWGSPSNQHCVTCHFPVESVGAQACNVCHRSTPTHERTPKRPANSLHGPSADCRSCHTPLRHPDNGMNCTVCHTQ